MSSSTDSNSQAYVDDEAYRIPRYPGQEDDEPLQGVHPGQPPPPPPAAGPGVGVRYQQPAAGGYNPLPHHRGPGSSAQRQFSSSALRESNRFSSSLHACRSRSHLRIYTSTRIYTCAYTLAHVYTHTHTYIHAYTHAHLAHALTCRTHTHSLHPHTSIHAFSPHR